MSTQPSLFEKLSCGENVQELYGIHYTYDMLPSEDLSLLVSGVDMTGPGICRKDDAKQYISMEERSICLKLLQGACKTLEDRFVDLGRCPCFNENKLDIAVKSIQDGSKVLVEGSCTSNSSGDTIDFFYEDPSSTWPWPTVEGYSIYVSSIIDSRRCLFDGHIVVYDISKKSATGCFKLIKNACPKIV